MNLTGLLRAPKKNIARQMKMKTNGEKVHKLSRKRRQQNKKGNTEKKKEEEKEKPHVPMFTRVTNCGRLMHRWTYKLLHVCMKV